MINRFVLIVILLFVKSLCSVSEFEESATTVNSSREISGIAAKHRSVFVVEAKQYVMQKSIRNDYFLLFDLSIHSGKKRLFLVDLQTGEAVDSFMVAHGAGKNAWASDFAKDKPQTSNALNSHLTSVGKYHVGNRDYSSWGIHVKYWLYGQDSTNSNAVKRVVVLHSWDYTPDEEVYPDGTPESWGCPAVSDRTMKKLDELLSSSNKKMLLWIVD